MSVIIAFWCIFTVRCSASTVYFIAMCLSVHPSVCVWPPEVCCTETPKCRIMQTVPHDSPGNLVFDAKDLCDIRLGSPPMDPPNAVWVA